MSRFGVQCRIINPNLNAFISSAGVGTPSNSALNRKLDVDTNLPIVFGGWGHRFEQFFFDVQNFVIIETTFDIAIIVMIYWYMICIMFGINLAVAGVMALFGAESEGYGFGMDIVAAGAAGLTLAIPVTHKIAEVAVAPTKAIVRAGDNLGDIAIIAGRVSDLAKITEKTSDLARAASRIPNPKGLVPSSARGYLSDVPKINLGNLPEAPRPTISPENALKLEQLKLAGCVSSNTFNPNSTNIAQAVPERNPLDKLLMPSAEAYTSNCDILKGMKPNWMGRAGEFDHYRQLENKLFALKSDATYTRNNYKYMTDSYGRIKQVAGELKLGDSKRPNLAKVMPHMEGYDKGHLIAHRFGGSPDMDNLVRMRYDVNRPNILNGEYSKLEGKWAEALAKGEKVWVEIKPIWGNDVSYPAPIRFETKTIKTELSGKVIEAKQVIQN